MQPSDYRQISTSRKERCTATFKATTPESPTQEMQIVPLLLPKVTEVPVWRVKNYNCRREVLRHAHTYEQHFSSCLPRSLKPSDPKRLLCHQHRSRLCCSMWDSSFGLCAGPQAALEGQSSHTSLPLPNQGFAIPPSSATATSQKRLPVNLFLHQ